MADADARLLYVNAHIGKVPVLTTILYYTTVYTKGSMWFNAHDCMTWANSFLNSLGKCMSTDVTHLYNVHIIAIVYTRNAASVNISYARSE